MAELSRIDAQGLPFDLRDAADVQVLVGAKEDRNPRRSLVAERRDLDRRSIASRGDQRENSTRREMDVIDLFPSFEGDRSKGHVRDGGFSGDPLAVLDRERIEKSIPGAGWCSVQRISSLSQPVWWSANVIFESSVPNSTDHHSLPT